MRTFTLATLLALAACGGPILGSGGPVTTLDPPPGPFNDVVTVTMTTEPAADVVFTTDGSDPLTSETKQTKPSPVTLELSATTTLKFFAVDGWEEEPVREAQYIRAGGAKGTASGVIVVDTIALERGLALFADGSQTTLSPVTEKTEIPFLVEGLGTGQHRLRAMADRDDDGNFLPVLDLASETYNFQIDLDDPFKASVEDVRLYLGASLDGLCTLQGEISVPEAALGESVSIAALGGDAFSGNTDPTALLAQLQNGYQVFAREGTDIYPYAITDLEPGLYIPVPLRTTFGLGGIGLNLLANPFSPVNCRAGQVKTEDFSFGSVSVSGTVSFTPPEETDGVVWGLVVAKQTSLLAGLQAVLMPVLFSGPDETGARTTEYAGSGLRRGSFSMRVFTSLDEENALTSALSWVINPLSQVPAHETISVGTTDVEQDFVLPEPPPAP